MRLWVCVYVYDFSVCQTNRVRLNCASCLVLVRLVPPVSELEQEQELERVWARARVRANSLVISLYRVCRHQ